MASASAVTSKCFKPASFCVNCNRKGSHLYKKDNVDIPMKVETSRGETKSKGDVSCGKRGKGGPSKIHKKGENMDYKTKSMKNDSNDKIGDSKTYTRCNECWLMSYCDETCQKEHWSRVHRFHCDFLSGKRVSKEHSEDSCVECITQNTAGKDQFRDINSPKTGCRFKEESKQMNRELGKSFRFHADGHNCNCGNEFACEYPFPIGNILGNGVATGLDEMMTHAAKLCNAFIVKSMQAKEGKDTISRLLDLNKSILDLRVRLWMNILNSGDIGISSEAIDKLGNSKREVEGKLNNENPWWKSLEFTIIWIMRTFVDHHWSRQMKDIPITATNVNEKIELCQFYIKNVAMISEKNLWYRLKMWPKKVNDSLVLLLPNDVHCASCNADLSGQVVGSVNFWDPSNPSPSLFSVVANNGGVSATCSPVQNYDCGKNHATKLGATDITVEECQEYEALLEKTRICHLCLTSSLSSHRCKGCMAAQYCSKECYEKDWRDFHKSVCSTWAKSPTRSLMSKLEQKEVTKKLVQKCGYR